MDNSSITKLIVRLKESDPQATEALWQAYFDRLTAAARKQLGGFPTRAFDEEDVALSVLHSLCKGAARGSFSRLTIEADLWALLLALTKQKSIDRIRRETRQKRGGGKIRGESLFGQEGTSLGLKDIVSDDVTPADLASLVEHHALLMQSLPDDNFRRVAELRFEGHTVKEIAEQLGYTTRWVERKLELIREKWAGILAE